MFTAEDKLAIDLEKERIFDYEYRNIVAEKSEHDVQGGSRMSEEELEENKRLADANATIQAMIQKDENEKLI